MSRRAVLVVALLLALALTVGGFFLLTRFGPPAATRFGWAADLTTLAGNGSRGTADGMSADARFSDPFGLVIDPSGVLYVADAGETNRIRRIDPDGRTTTLPGAFDTPSGLALDPAGNLIVADTGANRIHRISPDGVMTTIAGDGTAGYRDGDANRARFNGPIGVAVDAAGIIYVADSYNDRIRRIDGNGQVTTLAGNGAQGFRDGQGIAAAFDTPSGIIVDRNGALIVADTGNDAIRRVDPNGHVGTLALSMRDDRNGLLKTPIGLAESWDGYLYITSYRRGRILQMSPAGELRVLTGRGAAVPGNESLQLATPTGLALDRDGALYIADASKYAVRKLGRRTAASPAPGPDLPTPPPALVEAKRFPWPVAPQLGWHEVVGDLGEVRGNYSGESRDHFHAGLDIHAGIGERVLAVADEKVADPLPNGSLGGLSEALRVDAMTYIHMRVGRDAQDDPIDPARFRLIHDAAGELTGVRVKRGTRFRVGDALGTVNRMAHVHLELGPPGGKVNAMALRFPGLTDRFAPRIAGIHLVDEAGQRLSETQDGRIVVSAVSGPLGIVVDAWDQVDGNMPYRRLGLHRLGYQLLHAGGRAVRGFERPQITQEYDRLPRDPDAVKIAYASDSGISVHSGRATRFLYMATNRVHGGEAEVGGWRPTGLKAGDYLIRIYAGDRAGNVAQANRDLPIRVR